MSHPWQKALVVAKAKPAHPGLKIKPLIKIMKGAPGVTASGTLKVGQYDAVWTEREIGHGKSEAKRRDLVIIKGKEMIFLIMMVDKKNWKKTGPDFDAIMKSLNFVEKDKEKDKEKEKE